MDNLELLISKIRTLFHPWFIYSGDSEKTFDLDVYVEKLKKFLKPSKVRVGL